MNATETSRPNDSELKREIAGHWDKRSRWFDGEQGLRNEVQDRAWSQLLRSELGDAPLATLDVGTGTGVLAILLAELGHRSCGVELSPGMLEIAQKNAEKRDVEVSWHVGDAENLSFEDETFDLVINRNVLWTLPDPARALQEWQRVLKPGGLLMILDGNWFDRSLGHRLQQFLATMLATAKTGKNPWHAIRRRRKDYSNHFEKHLSLMRPGSRQKILDLVQKTGFRDLESRWLPEIDKAEKSGLSMEQRLMRPHNFYIVKAAKDLS